ncbi:MAG: hypothetical protein NC033_04285 [Clostridiales bacterium]|nr:hypothetical protein [Clostridiales bacterium]
MNKITEEQLNRETIQEIEFEIPKGKNPIEYLKEFFGIESTAHEELPNDIDIDKSFVIKFVTEPDNEQIYSRTNDDTNYVDNNDEDIIKFKQNLEKYNYTLKRYESICEKKFYKSILRNLSRDYHLIAQVCLASIIDKKQLDGSDAEHRGELFRIIDFGIFDDNYEIKLLIDKSIQKNY